MKVLVDTSIWVDHLRRPEPGVIRLIAVGDLLMHPGVRGELVVGNLPARREMLVALRNLPLLAASEWESVFAFIESNRLYGRGLSWVDTQLLCAVGQARHQLWTRDVALRQAAETLGLAWVP